MHNCQVSLPPPNKKRYITIRSLTAVLVTLSVCQNSIVHCASFYTRFFQATTRPGLTEIIKQMHNMIARTKQEHISANFYHTLTENILYHTDSAVLIYSSQWNRIDQYNRTL